MKSFMGYGKVTLFIVFTFLFFTIQKMYAMNPSDNSTKAAMRTIAEKYEQAFFERYPEQALHWGRKDAILDRFTDTKLSAFEKWNKVEDKFLHDLNALNVEELKGSPEHLTYQLLKETLENEKQARVCKNELWHVNPLWGWHIVASVVAEKQPVGTPEYRSAAIKRWRTFKDLTSVEIDNLKIGLREGYSAPKPVVQRVIKQLTILLNTPIEDSPFFAFAKRDGTPEFKNEMARLIENEIYPALSRYAQFLETEYLPQARDKAGVSSLPNGEQCYKAKIIKETTLNVPAQAIFDFGLSHMQQIKREVATIGEREFGIQEISEVFRIAKEKSRHYFHSEQEILDYNLAALARVKEKSPAWFDHLPKAEGIIKPYPPHRAITGAPGEYHPPGDDGEPGIFYINTHDPQNRSRIDLEATLFHELIPGHHYQVALVVENKSFLPLNKYLWNSGYGEGWALYTERLADEMGLYSDDISRLGMLSNEALRAARLVVDPGMHVMNWSREQAVEYLKMHTAMDDAIIESEVDRYIMLAGQATSYMLGKQQIEKLRDQAKAKLGNNFDIRQFHNQVLKNGTVTLPMLQAQIEDWIDKQA